MREGKERQGGGERDKEERRQKVLDRDRDYRQTHRNLYGSSNAVHLPQSCL